MGINKAPSDAAKKPAFWRRFLQFRLRTLMLAMLILPIGLGWLAQARSKSQKAWANVEAIERATTIYDLTTESFLEWHNAPWWQRKLGIDLPRDIEKFSLHVPNGDEKTQVHVLTRLHAFPRLKHLSMSNVCVSATALKPLEHFPMLEDLEISGGRSEGEEESDSDGIYIIANLPRLKRFECSNGDLQEHSEALLTMTSLEDLKWVTSTKSDFKLDWSRMQCLRRLYLIGSPVGLVNNDRHKRRVNGNYAVSQIAKLERLEYLELSADCSTEGLRPLLQTKHLKHLSLQSDRITDNDLAMLADIPSLETLEIDSIDVTQEAIDNWKVKRPELTITKK